MALSDRQRTDFERVVTFARAQERAGWTERDVPIPRATVLAVAAALAEAEAIARSAEAGEDARTEEAMDLADRLTEAEARAERLRATCDYMLWEYHGEHTRYCRFCRGAYPHHAHDCKAAALLAEPPAPERQG